jgi:hypothetical protein
VTTKTTCYPLFISWRSVSENDDETVDANDNDDDDVGQKREEEGGEQKR